MRADQGAGAQVERGGRSDSFPKDKPFEGSQITHGGSGA